MSKATPQVGKSPVIARPNLEWGTCRYRVRASDSEGGPCASGLLTLDGAWEWVNWLQGFGKRFTLIRIEAAREAMIAPSEGEA